MKKKKAQSNWVGCRGKRADERETKEEAARNKASNVLNRSKLIYNYIDNQGIEHFLEDIMYLTCKKESKN